MADDDKTGAAPDHRADARGLFQGIAGRHGLQYAEETPAEIDLGFRIPEQPGMSFELILTLQDTDELFIYIGNVRFSFAPFASREVQKGFADIVEGLIEGRVRVTLGQRPGASAPVKATIERRRNGDWQVVARHSSTLWPFGLTTRVLHNEPRD
jgi:hypothetical protein